MGLAKIEYQSKICHLTNIIKEKERRLEKLFCLVETTDIDMKSVSPRIKALSDEKEQLIKEKSVLQLKIDRSEFPKVTDEELEPFVIDLQNTLLTGTTAERKTFIRSFIKKITIDYPTVEIEYTIPIDSEKNLDKEVLIINKSG